MDKSWSMRIRAMVAGLMLAGCGAATSPAGLPSAGAAQAFIHDHTACPAVRYDWPQWAADRAGSTPGGLIYFIAVPVRGGTDDLHAVTSLGRADRLLLKDALAPMVSPDGATVLFQRASPGTIQSYHFFVYDVTSGQNRPLSTAGVRASWSPDSRWFVYATPSGPVSGINKIDVQTNQIEQLSRGAAWSDWPMWSPDGRMIAFTRAQNAGPTDIQLIGSDGGGLTGLGGLDRLVCPGSGGVDEGRQLAAWRPDGRALAVQRICQDRTTVSIVTPAGVEASHLDVPGADVQDLSWSPGAGSGSGAHLLFTAHDRNTGIDSLVVAGPDGSNPRTVQAHASQAGWSPDGRQIVFVGQDAAGLDELYTIRVDGSGLSQITDNPGNGLCLR